MGFSSIVLISRLVHTLQFQPVHIMVTKVHSTFKDGPPVVRHSQCALLLSGFGVGTELTQDVYVHKVALFLASSPGLRCIAQIKVFAESRQQSALPGSGF
jgi:hypothetical protein